MRELEINFAFAELEKKQLRDALLALDKNPYVDCFAFQREIAALIDSGFIPARYCDFVRDRMTLDQFANPFTFVENAPLDLRLPVFSHTDPVTEKRQIKQTFVIEGVLEAYAQLSGCPAIGYKNVNDGDIYQDIFPKEDLFYTQSQKALGPIYFHKDLANHFVRPDYVNILSVRSFDANKIYTTFVRNKDVLENLAPSVREALQRPEFCTPYDDLTVHGNAVELGDAEHHSVIERETDFRYFETRTVGLAASAQAALHEFNKILHRCKKNVLMRPGDFVSIQNNASLHGKEIAGIADDSEARKRWSIKTVNVTSIEPHRRFLADGPVPLVNG